ncbi:XRE family transcriptional regulator [Moraxella marmotae]|uniref:XRE family transcriptional regulator n=1 Tax=Moraxella marmotae TaxID=3344520 RepID=UPI0035F27AD6
MKIKTNKQLFSERLNLAIKMAYPKGLKTSQIATQFNLQHPNDPVTQQAVHKWLTGLAIPSEDKILTLSKWLGTKPEWLIFGERTPDEQLSAIDGALIELIKELNEKQKIAIIHLIQSFKNEYQ